MPITSQSLKLLKETWSSHFTEEGNFQQARSLVHCPVSLAFHRTKPCVSGNKFCILCIEYHSSASWLLIINHATSLDFMNAIIGVGHRGNYVWASRLASILQSDLHPISSFSWTFIVLLHCLTKDMPSREKNMSENTTVGDKTTLKIIKYCDL